MVTDTDRNELQHDWLAKHRKRAKAPDQPANDDRADDGKPAA